MPRAALAAAVLLAGCGYRFAAGPGVLPGDVRAVRAPIFSNQTAEPGLEVVFTRALRQELQHAGVGYAAESDAEIRGEVLNVWGGPTILTGTGRLASYRIFASARLQLVKGGAVLAQTDVTGSEDYLPGFEDIQLSEANREAALRRLAERLMREAYERLATR